MPIYTYTCKGCNYIFEELSSYETRDEAQSCPLCGEAAERNAAETFGIKTTIDPKRDTVYTPKEIDKVVGSDAEKKWAGYDKKWENHYKQRQAVRWGDKAPAEVKIPKESDGKYAPLMHLGDKKERSLRKEFSTALKEHRAEREKKGIKQFDAPGSIL